MKIRVKIIYLTFFVFLMMSLNIGMAGQQVMPQTTTCPPPPKPPCDCHFQGCTPGYWKNHTDMWVLAVPGLSGPPTEFLLYEVFIDFGPTFPGWAGDLNGDGIPDTLLDALRYHGGRGVEGAARILLRAGVAALLNVSHSGVLYRGCWWGLWYVGDVINKVLLALDTGDRGNMLYLARRLDDFNNSYCPLN
jgi:hypothetical protein